MTYGTCTNFVDADSVTFTTTKILMCPGWETHVVLVSQPGTPVRDKRGVFCPGSGNRDKRGPFVPVGNTNRGKRCCQRPHGWRTLLSRLVLTTGTKGPFFHIFLFSILFLFQLYFCISIKLMYWNSVCMISTNIYIYIVTYIIFIIDSFHI